MLLMRELGEREDVNKKTKPRIVSTNKSQISFIR